MLPALSSFNITDVLQRKKYDITALLLIKSVGRLAKKMVILLRYCLLNPGCVVHRNDEIIALLLIKSDEMAVMIRKDEIVFLGRYKCSKSLRCKNYIYVKEKIRD